MGRRKKREKEEHATARGGCGVENEKESLDGREELNTKLLKGGDCPKFLDDFSSSTHPR
jgi:hypothetical protein